MNCSDMHQRYYDVILLQSTGYDIFDKSYLNVEGFTCQLGYLISCNVYRSLFKDALQSVLCPVERLLRVRGKHIKR